MTDLTFRPVGRLVAIFPKTDRARNFCDSRWPYGAPNTCRNTEGGQLLGDDDFTNALVAIADAGLEIDAAPPVVVRRYQSVDIFRDAEGYYASASCAIHFGYTDTLADICEEIDDWRDEDDANHLPLDTPSLDTSFYDGERVA